MTEYYGKELATAPNGIIQFKCYGTLKLPDFHETSMEYNQGSDIIRIYIRTLVLSHQVKRTCPIAGIS